MLLFYPKTLHRHVDANVPVIAEYSVVVGRHLIVDANALAVGWAASLPSKPRTLAAFMSLIATTSATILTLSTANDVHNRL